LYLAGSGRSNIDFAGQVKLDVQYIETACFGVDLKLVLQTFRAVVNDTEPADESIPDMSRPMPRHLRANEMAPLANIPMLGKNLAEYWIEHLVMLGAKEVRVLTTDRPDLVCARLGMARVGVCASSCSPKSTS